MMKRIFTLIASIVLATSLLAVPCFAAEPEDLPTPQPGVTATEQPDGSDPVSYTHLAAFHPDRHHRCAGVHLSAE